LASDVSDLNDTVDHVRGPRSAHLIVESGDYECPYSRQAYRQVQQMEDQLGGEVQFTGRHFSLTDIHPHALASAELREHGGVGDAAPGQRTDRAHLGRLSLVTEEAA
jgi:hypothetical protein